ncbi:argininosuccinate lyase [Buchnera aphidicola (Ceratoglyphina bambusae)]|uniref:argininosuccinate lyase n=1 Tax=Buchnera aphidicola TaxID=9 RepID=UPI0031B89748
MFLWGGRFKKKSNKDFLNFNKSINFDYMLAKQDISASIAWSKSLLLSNLISKKEQKIIENCLKNIKKYIKINLKKVLKSNCEDIHTWIEKKLIKEIGDLGKKLHTGRSRNEQTTTNLKMWCKYYIKKLLYSLKNLKLEFLNLSKKYINIVMPGYTHLQIAQPIVFSHWCLAYYEMLKRDENRLNYILKRLDFCPLGSGAISGVSHYINRIKLANDINFKNITKNSIDSVSDRDYVIEMISCASIGMMHLSRLSEDLIFFNTSEADFIELSDKITSGSSLMPQKKNPDILELIRGKCGRVYGSLINILVVLKGIPMSYNKDMQEDKECLFDSMITWNNCIKMSTLVIKNITLNRSNCFNAVKNSFSNSTELVDYLVHKGVCFRDAHKIVGKIVLKLIKEHKYLHDIKILDLKKYNNLFEEDVYKYISIEKTLERKNSIGGTSKKQILEYIKLEQKKI